MFRSYFKALFRREIADVVAEPQRREAPRTPRARKPIGAKAAVDLSISGTSCAHPPSAGTRAWSQADRRDCSRKRVLK